MDKELKASILKIRMLSSGSIPVMLSDEELFGLICVILHDLNRSEMAEQHGIKASFEVNDYFQAQMSAIQATSEKDLITVITQLTNEIDDFFTYFKCLCELHKRRKKFSLIMHYQPLPTMQQVAPRSLIEFGNSSPAHIYSWLTWRKWLYDIDNRSAQETGYIFEPIIAASLGGAPFPASKSPIKRTKDGSKGRQVDCIIDDFAYEFKMRVTIAASGQGRFQEELDFAEDCHNSGYKPMLLVLDPTPSTKYSDLKKQFEKYGGQALSGDEAWQHIASKSGDVMSTFIAKYVKKPLEEVEATDELESLTIKPQGNSFSISIGDTEIINRAQLQSESDSVEI